MKLWRLRALAAIPLAAAFYFQPGVGALTAHGMSYSQLNTIQKRILSGQATLEFNPAGEKASSSAGAQYTPVGTPNRSAASGTSVQPASSSYQPSGAAGCSQTLGANVKVNQNCLNLSDADLQGRSQAQNETSIAIDPNNPNHIISSYNDYRRGDGNCGISYSMDGGLTWADSTAPTGFVRGTAYGGVAREYFEAAGDTAVGFDNRGNAYLQCQMFDRPGVTNNQDLSSAVYVYRATQNGGASWNFTGRPVVEFNDTAGAGTTLIDKPMMAVDHSSISGHPNRVYVTWTDFASDGTAYIYEAHSDDYGESFSSPVVVSGDLPSLCTQTYRLATPHGSCNENQYSDPFLGPGGALYVAYSNFNNTPTGGATNCDPGGASQCENYNQVLLAKSTDGGDTFGTPVLVANYYDLPDCATYENGQDPGRGCVPEHGPGNNSYFRASNYPSGTVDPYSTSRVIVTVGSYINTASKESSGCSPAGLSPYGINLYNGVKTNCSNHILVSESQNYGASFSGASTNARSMTVTNATHNADQWFQWAASTPGSTTKMVVSYYDRQYGSDETTGYSDFTLATSTKASEFTTWAGARVTSASMPPPTEFSGLFWGDYTGVDAINNGHPSWSDTRNEDLILCPGASSPTACSFSGSNASVANDQDVFSQGVTLP